MPTSKVTRRSFLQGLAAGLAVAQMPVGIALAERTAKATEILKADGWKFMISGGSGGMGNSLIMVAPGSIYDPYLIRQLCWPEKFTVSKASEYNQMMLTPWHRYKNDIEHLIPTNMWPKYVRARNWRG